MINNLLFSRTVTPDLEKSLDAYSLRQKTLANNIANAMTPGYQAQKVSFEEEYRSSLYDNTMRGTRNDQRHIHIGPKTFNDVKPQVAYRNNPINDSGINNVDIDKEMAEMAENSLRYDMSTRLLTKRLQNVRSSIRGR